MEIVLTRPSDGLDQDDLKAVFDKYRLLAHEQLREPTSYLLKKLQVLAEKADTDAKFLLRTRTGEVEVRSITEFKNIESEAARRGIVTQLAYSQIVLPPGCGRLDRGMFSPEWRSLSDSEAEETNRSPYDVSAQPEYRDSAVFHRTLDSEGTWSLKQLCGSPINAGSQEDLANAKPKLPDLREFASKHAWRFLLRVPLSKPEADEDAAAAELLYFGPAKQKSPVGDLPYLLEDHLADVAKHGNALAKRLAIPELAPVFEAAGSLHDLGKEAPIWQKAAGNYGDSFVGGSVAKSIKPMRSRELNGFRHELLSLRQAISHLQEEPPESHDLILHLIAAHHGHSRPYFAAKTYDRRDLSASKEAAIASAHRFSRLQKQFGPWGLAYLEAILRAADGLASSEWEDPAHA
jgi:CRISPR-associated helicase Cas3